MANKREQLKVVIVGHVDHGKSTLIGRLLHDTDSLPDGKIDEIKKSCETRNVPFEWSFVLDSFQAERDQAITIDTTQMWFKSKKRDYVIIDAPGHREFLKNMISGAAQADAAILVIDALEGVKEQTRRHAYLLHLLDVKQFVVTVNKMDAVNYDMDRFNAVKEEIISYLQTLGHVPQAVIPMAAKHGDNIAAPSPQMTWHLGDSLLQTLDGFSLAAGDTRRGLRFPVQDVYRFDERRILAGRIESGAIRVGDTLTFSPANRSAKVVSIENWPETETPVLAAQAGQAVGITLDQPIFVERGDIASHAEDAPMLTNVLRMHLFWLSDKPLEVGATYRIKLATRIATVTVQAIERVISTEDLASASGNAVRRNDMAEIVLRSREMIALDPYHANPKTGRAVLIDQYDLVGGGIISMDGYPDQRHALHKATENLYEVDHLLPVSARVARNGHGGAVIWLTGFSGAGKSTLAMRVEQALFARGFQTYVLDGDNVRKGLNADLGFSPDDRAENIRRVGEVAALMADAGLVVITAFISPYRADRARARVAAQGAFHEVWVKAGLDACEQRDPKGLYKKARAGKISDFTGISSPYEAPDAPELIVDTETQSIDECVSALCTYIMEITQPSVAADVTRKVQA